MEEPAARRGIAARPASIAWRFRYRAILIRRSRVSSLSIAPSMVITSTAAKMSTAIIVIASRTAFGRPRRRYRLIDNEQAMYVAQHRASLARCAPADLERMCVRY
jgi:hypothetical protein